MGGGSVLALSALVSISLFLIMKTEISKVIGLNKTLWAVTAGENGTTGPWRRITFKASKHSNGRKRGRDARRQAFISANWAQIQALLKAS